jgi:transcriptional regulator with XRE-family HTH domain
LNADKDVARLRERLAAALQSMPQGQTAAALGVDPKTLLNWRKGVSSPPADKLMLLAKIAGYPTSWFFNEAEQAVRQAYFGNSDLTYAEMLNQPTTFKDLGLLPADEEHPQKAQPLVLPSRQSASPPGSVILPVLDVEAAAGAGRFEAEFKKIDEVAFPNAWLRKLGANPRKSEFIRVLPRSDSMMPTLAPGAQLRVDRAQTDTPQRTAAERRRNPADIFVFNHSDDGVRVKRIEALKNGLLLISDNAQFYPPEFVGSFDALTVHGKVVWWDNRL